MRSRGVRVRTAFAAMTALAVSVVGGCSLLVSTDELSSGGPLITEGGVESGAPDVVVAPVDGGADADASSRTFSCAALNPKPKLCADFDTGASLSELGSIIGMPVIDSTRSASPGRSMRAVVDAKSTGRSCLVTHPFNDTPSSIELSYRIFIGAYDATKDMELVTAQMAKPGGTGFCTLITSVRRGAWTADESCETSGTPTYVASHTSDIRYTPGGWTKVRLVVSLVPPRTLSLEIDDSKALTDVAIDDRLATYPVSLGIGLRYVQVNADTASVNLDDLVFDYE